MPGEATPEADEQVITVEVRLRGPRVALDRLTTQLTDLVLGGEHDAWGASVLVRDVTEETRAEEATPEWRAERDRMQARLDEAVSALDRPVAEDGAWTVRERPARDA